MIICDSDLIIPSVLAAGMGAGYDDLPLRQIFPVLAYVLPADDKPPASARRSRLIVCEQFYLGIIIYPGFFGIQSDLIGMFLDKVAFNAKQRPRQDTFM